MPPYWAVTAGPKSHSPAPIAEPATRTPGPISSAECRQSNPGGGIRSPTCQGAIDPSGAATTSVAGEIDMVVLISCWGAPRRSSSRDDSRPECIIRSNAIHVREPSLRRVAVRTAALFSVQPKAVLNG